MNTANYHQRPPSAMSASSQHSSLHHNKSMNQLEVVSAKKNGVSLKVIQNELIELYLMLKNRGNREEKSETEIHRLSKMEIGALI